jgi:hypothetical protein
LPAPSPADWQLFDEVQRHLTAKGLKARSDLGASLDSL